MGSSANDVQHSAVLISMRFFSPGSTESVRQLLALATLANSGEHGGHLIDCLTQFLDLIYENLKNIQQIEKNVEGFCRASTES